MPPKNIYNALIAVIYYLALLLYNFSGFSGLLVVIKENSVKKTTYKVKVLEVLIHVFYPNSNSR